MRLRERSRMVLMAAGGMTNKAIAAKLGLNRPEQGRAVEAAVRGRGAGRDCEGASAGWQPRRQELGGPGGAEARGDPADDADRSAGRDALVVPVHGAGGGDDAQLRAPGLALRAG